MIKFEAIQRLCQVVTLVGRHFNSKYAHDCICGDGLKHRYNEPDVSEEVIQFIENAVKAAIGGQNGHSIERAQ